VGRMEASKKYTHVPELLLGFDTETTGLDVEVEQAISYGFVFYQLGNPIWSTQFFVRPEREIEEGAKKVHGMSLDDLEVRSGGGLLSVSEGLIRALSILKEFHHKGAHIVGANVSGFDISMLRFSSQKFLGDQADVATKFLNELRTIDVVAHDVKIEPREVNPRRRGLSALCEYYGVQPGGHDALEDARAAVEVFVKQVERNLNGQSGFEFVFKEFEFINSLEHKVSNPE
jgi:DNA polymerase III epsilon subunit-like protein